MYRGSRLLSGIRVAVLATSGKKSNNAETTAGKASFLQPTLIAQLREPAWTRSLDAHS
jgi:hypothetical protein